MPAVVCRKCRQQLNVPDGQSFRCPKCGGVGGPTPGRDDVLMLEPADADAEPGPRPMRPGVRFWRPAAWALSIPAFLFIILGGVAGDTERVLLRCLCVAVATFGFCHAIDRIAALTGPER